MTKKIFIETVSSLFIVLFFYAALSKIFDFEQFNAQLGKSPLITAFADIAAIAVPSVEIIISIMLSIPRLRLFGLHAAFSLMVMFTTYIIIILNFSLYIPCSCGGILEKLGWEEHLMFNIAFIFLAMSAILVDSSESKTNATTA